MTPVVHPKLSRTLRDLAAADCPNQQCGAPPSSELLKALHEFNARAFFECHETLELLWRAEEQLIRYFYQGLLHVGVGYLHLQRGNHHGAVTKLTSGIQLLGFFRPVCHGVDVAALVAAAEGHRDQLVAFGPDRLKEFDQSRIPTARLVRSPSAIHPVAEEHS
jgi:predicted metal-dependent hydrolase